MAYFEDYKQWPPGNPFGYMPIEKLMEILATFPKGYFITTGFNGLPVMTILDANLEHVGMVEPHSEDFESFLGDR